MINFKYIKYLVKTNNEQQFYNDLSYDNPDDVPRCLLVWTNIVEAMNSVPLKNFLEKLIEITGDTITVEDLKAYLKKSPKLKKRQRVKQAPPTSKALLNITQQLKNIMTALEEILKNTK